MSRRAIFLFVLGLTIVMAWAVYSITLLVVSDLSLVWALVPVFFTIVCLAIFAAFEGRRRALQLRETKIERAIIEPSQVERVRSSQHRRDAEIVQHKIRQAIAAIKATNQRKGARGSAALYSLPWYVLVGPTGSGKTGLIRGSGLSFPYLDPDRGGVPALVGGDSCDVWFGRDAILLDVAGRYVTDAAQRDEWQEMLTLLRHARPEKPLNGIIVTLGLDTLVAGESDALGSATRLIRARLDELSAILEMQLPVYVVFTKADLIPGFIDCFRGLDKSGRARPLGATFAMSAQEFDPGEAFQSEFDILSERIQGLAFRRMAEVDGTMARERIVQLPFEWSGMRRALSFAVTELFREIPATPSPIFRGFYFTSSCQEGQPLEQLLGQVGRAVGIRSAVADDATNVLDTRAYFTQGLFERVIFPERHLGGRTRTAQVQERRRRALLLFALSFASVMTLLPVVISYDNNKRLLRESENIASDAASLDPRAVAIGSETLRKLNEVRNHLERLERYENDGAPLFYRWFDYVGEDVYPALLDKYAALLEAIFVQSAREQLEASLGRAGEQPYLTVFGDLKAYLLLSDRERLDAGLRDWETDRLLNLWLHSVRGEGRDLDVEGHLRAHFRFYVDLLARGRVRGRMSNSVLVERARECLARLSSENRLYEQIVSALKDEKIDPSGASKRENLRYPPISLTDILGKSEASDELRSARMFRTSVPSLVEGPFTRVGRERVQSLLADAEQVVSGERWVLGQSIDKKDLTEALTAVRDRYVKEYIGQWESLLRDIELRAPANLDQATVQLGRLVTPERPYARLLNALREHTQPSEVAPLKAEHSLIEKVRRVVTPAGEKAGMPTGSLERAFELVSKRFQSIVQFAGANTTPASGETVESRAQSTPEAPLVRYMGVLERLVGELRVIQEGSETIESSRLNEIFAAALKETQQLALSLDGRGQELFVPLLLQPLKHAYKALVQSASGAASGLWEVSVWPSFRDSIRGRYPFERDAARDASFEDTMAFLRPDDGVLWGFFDQNLKGFLSRRDSEFVIHSGLGRSARERPLFSPGLFRCLKRADEITRALFPSKGEKPGITFDVRLKSVSPEISEVVLEVDGQRIVYRNERESFHTLTWPGEKRSGARLEIRGALDLSEEIVRKGPWGLFRLLESGKNNAVSKDDSLFTVTFKFAAPRANLTIEVRPSRMNHPLATGFFRNLECPSTIGSAEPR